jgi:hypothetical protein
MESRCGDPDPRSFAQCCCLLTALSLPFVSNSGRGLCAHAGRGEERVRAQAPRPLASYLPNDLKGCSRATCRASSWLPHKCTFQDRLCFSSGLLREAMLTLHQGGESEVVSILRREPLGLGSVAHLCSDQTHGRPLSERVGDLSNFVDLIDQRPELVLGTVAGYIDLILDFI